MKFELVTICNFLTFFYKMYQLATERNLRTLSLFLMVKRELVALL